MNNTKQPKIHSGYMEVAVANLIGFRQNTIVPNVSWGLGLSHECDMLVLDSQERFTEIEIKISASDLKADFKKDHSHESSKISRLVYAVPLELVELAKTLIPEKAGLISVTWAGRLYKPCFVASWVKQCKHNKNRPTQQTIKRFMELGCMRIWSLKSKLYTK